MKRNVPAHKRIQLRDEPSSIHTEHTGSKVAPKDADRVLSDEAQEDLPLNYYHLLWIFVVASVIGLILETIYHFIVFGGYESRAGLIWGPFSPLYGCGAVLFALISRGKHIERKSKTIITVFLACAFAGAALEFAASWLMQTFFGVIAWDYSDTFFNLQGRTNLFFGLIWGFLGTAWICWCLPAIIRFIDRIPISKNKLVTVFVSLFMVLNIITTVMAVGRAYERSQGIPEQSHLDAIMDSVYGDEFIEEHFENATVDPSLNETKKEG